MASLKKRPGSPYYVCCYTKANGERTQKSTKQAAKEKAWEVCLAWSRLESMGRSKTLTESTARKVIAEIVERTTGQPLVFHSAEEWLRDWLADKGVSKSAGTHVRYKNTVESFITHLGERAKLGLGQITPRDVQTFRNQQLREGKTGHTANLAVKHLRIPFNVARRQGIIQNSPADAVDMVAVEKVDRGVFTAEQVGALLTVAPADWRTAILLAYYTGARLQDVCNMRRESADLAAKLIRFRPQKTKKEVVIPIHPELEDYLLKLEMPDVEKAPLMPTLIGRKTGGAHGLSSTFKSLMKLAKVSGEVARQAQGKGRQINTLSFHSFRHTFNSAMANQGVAQELRQKLTGHLSADMNKIYTHHELATLRTAIGVIPTVFSGLVATGHEILNENEPSA